MENASKALIMLGGVLIAILVVSLAVGAIMTFGNFSKDMNTRIAADKIADFNQHFTKYEARIDITSEEIATIINFAKNNNDAYELEYDDFINGNESVYWVNIWINGINVFEDFGKDNYIDKNKFKRKLNQFVEQYNETYFYCNVQTEGASNKPKVEQFPNGNTKGIIHINTKKDDITYSVNSSNQTQKVTGISFGITDDGGSHSIINYGAYIDSIPNYQRFRVRNDAKKMYTYTFN